MKVIGLTGPAGAGKSEAANILARHGAYIIDADRIGHKLFEPQSDIWCKVLKAFGPQALMPGGKVNRHKLGEMVFSDPKKLRILNSITHPAIRRKIEEEIAEKNWRGKIVVVNSALPKLFEGLVDQTIVITTLNPARLKRLIKKGLPRAAAIKMMNAQMPLKNYLKIADLVISNDGTKKELGEKLSLLLLNKTKESGLG
ncbi:MAG: dephospho-CoA kinase [Candidatus Margulisiibacteriota bacterium]